MNPETSATNIAAAIGRLQAEALTGAGLAGEYADSLHEYFSQTAGAGGMGAGPGGELPEDPGAQARHLEWFLLERPSPLLGGPPVQELMWEEEPELIEILRSSVVGVFELTSQVGSGSWLRDLAGFGEYPVVGLGQTTGLAAGDLLIGRLFHLGDGSYHLAPTAGHCRDEKLREALRRDLDRARERGGSKVLRLSQPELEALFWSNPRDTAPGAARAAARACLLAGGLDEELGDEILGRLALVPYTGEGPVAGAGDVVGEILDELAFDSDLELGAARRLLVAAWRESSAAAPESPLESGLPAGTVEAGGRAGMRDENGVTSDPTRAVAQLRAGLEAGGEPEALYRQFEQSLGLEEGDAPLDGIGAAPDFPGVVGALVEEFIWDAGRAGEGEQAGYYACLRKLGRFGGDIGVVDNLSALDLLRFCALWVPEHDEVRNGDEGRELLAALGRFCRWCEEEQGLALRAEFTTQLRGLADSLPRIAEANRRRTRAEEEEHGTLYEVLAAEHGQLTLCLVAADSSTGTSPEVRPEVSGEVTPELAEWLASGDYLRGRLLADGRLAVYCSYPPEAGPLFA
ncbi:MAG TPA: hypothetical protein QF730_07030 [Planctomycetota bacterium]|nr:hypothetical protein [Planctomycetota bacterium]